MRNQNDEFKVKLTAGDNKILESYKSVCEGLSNYLGDSYEIILHSLGNLDHSAIKVLNGFHTGRSEGAPITNLALDILKEIKENGKNDTNLVYFTKNKKNEPMKSTTIPIKGDKGNIIGLLCINFYLNTPLADILDSLGYYGSQPPTASGEHRDEIFSNNSSEMLSDTVQKTRMEILADSSISSSNKNKEIIARLYEKGFFNFKDSIINCANVLNISKNTVYLHLKNIK